MTESDPNPRYVVDEAPGYRSADNGPYIVVDQEGDESDCIEATFDTRAEAETEATRLNG
jgi:hypothetical protein